MGRTTFLAAGTALLAATLTLTACGGGDGGKSDGAAPKSTLDAATSSATPSGADNSAKPPAELVTAALDNFKNAKSVHVKANFKGEGQAMSLDFHLGADQSDGTMQGGFGNGPATVKLRTVDGKFYMGADSAFWQGMLGDKTFASMLDGKWVLFPASQAKQFKTFLGVRQFDRDVFAQPRKDLTASSGLKTSRADVGGVPAIGVTGPDGKMTVFTAANGTPRLLRLSSTAAIGEMPEGTFDFTEYDAPLQIQAPADAIDTNKIKKART
ncbi:hypothetical protein AB0J52_20115 [Spirillospora sp. NPDC049652]